jgi:hypothetical protein
VLSEHRAVRNKKPAAAEVASAGLDFLLLLFRLSSEMLRRHTECGMMVVAMMVERKHDSQY